MIWGTVIEVWHPEIVVFNVFWVWRLIFSMFSTFSKLSVFSWRLYFNWLFSFVNITILFSSSLMKDSALRHCVPNSIYVSIKLTLRELFSFSSFIRFLDISIPLRDKNLIFSAIEFILVFIYSFYFLSDNSLCSDYWNSFCSY